jgi:hypothetical protein
MPKVTTPRTRGGRAPFVPGLIVRYPGLDRLCLASHHDAVRAVGRGVRRTGSTPTARAAGQPAPAAGGNAAVAQAGVAGEAGYLNQSPAQWHAGPDVRERFGTASLDGTDVAGTLTHRLPGGNAWAVGHARRRGGGGPSCCAQASMLRWPAAAPLGARAALTRRPHRGDSGNAGVRLVVRHIRLTGHYDQLAAVAAPACRWPSASGAGVRGAGPGARFPGLPTRASGRDAAAETVETTRTVARDTARRASHQVRAYNQSLCGAQPAAGGRAPGDLTGDSPDARKRAARQRVRR